MLSKNGNLYPYYGDHISN